MILKLLPNQISELWDSIRYAIINSVAPITDPTPENIQTICAQLMRQDMQCWCVSDENKDIHGYIITYISIDTITKFRTLIIYSVFLYNKASPEMWDDGISAMEKFAKANMCTRISAYTSNPAILSIAEKNGYTSDYTYLVKDVE